MKIERKKLSSHVQKSKRPACYHMQTSTKHLLIFFSLRKIQCFFCVQWRIAVFGSRLGKNNNWTKYHVIACLIAQSIEISTQFEVHLVNLSRHCDDNCWKDWTKLDGLKVYLPKASWNPLFFENKMPIILVIDFNAIKSEKKSESIG